MHSIERTPSPSTASLRTAKATATNAEQRRRRHLAVYHRALRSAKTPQQRAAVSARYRKLFAIEVTSEGPQLAEPVRLGIASVEPVRLAS